MTSDRSVGSWVEREVAALEADIRSHVVDLEEAFGGRDWVRVAQIYRRVAGLADRLEELDPNARSKVLDRLEREEAARFEAYASETDELDELSMRGDDSLAASHFLDPGDLEADDIQPGDTGSERPDAPDR